MIWILGYVSKKIKKSPRIYLRTDFFEGSDMSLIKRCTALHASNHKNHMFVRMMVRMLTQFSFLVGGKIHYIHVNIFKFFVLYSALIEQY